MTHRIATLPLLLLAAACGELETPDLDHGDVTGRLSGAAPGAFVYPLGTPQKKVAVASDGRFTLSGLPAGPVGLVLFDGDLRAELVVVEVRGARRTVFERSALAMPLAGRVVLAVVPEGGVAPVSPRYLVGGTDQGGLASNWGGAVIFPLPGGEYQLRAELAGFQAASLTMQVTSGQTGGVEVLLQVATTGLPGCTALGEQCRNGLHCDGTDGRCYQCRPDQDDCGPDASCDAETRFCTVTTGGAASPVCSTCSADQECGDVALGAYCEKVSGAATGYCSRRGPCPAGFGRDDTPPDGTHCRALLGCHTYFEEFGEQCFSDATCDERDGIAGGFCSGASQLQGVPGYCTAACGEDSDCIVSGFTCDPVERVCVRPPP